MTNHSFTKGYTALWDISMTKDNRDQKYQGHRWHEMLFVLHINVKTQLLRFVKEALLNKVLRTQIVSNVLIIPGNHPLFPYPTRTLALTYTSQGIRRRKKEEETENTSLQSVKGIHGSCCIMFLLESHLSEFSHLASFVWKRDWKCNFLVCFVFSYEAVTGSAKNKNTNKWGL